MSQKYLTKIFNEAKEHIPDVVRDVEPLGHGHFGLVVDHGDNTLTKIYFQPPEEKGGRYAVEGTLFNEVNALHCFGQNQPEGFEIPKLLSEPEFHDHEKYLASFRMTKVPGIPAYKYWEHFQHNSEEINKLHENMGRALAAFHRVALNSSFGGLDAWTDYGDEVKNIPYLKPDTNKALSKVNDFLQINRKAGVVHGDFHTGNIMVNKAGQVTGILDWSMAGMVRNQFVDMVGGVFPGFDGPFIRGYEAESGEKIDRTVLKATELAIWTSYFPRGDQEAHVGHESQIVEGINEYLNDLLPVTGYKP